MEQACWVSEAALSVRPLRYLVLASGSTARQAILSGAGIAHRVVPSGLEEQFVGADTEETVRVLAREKALAVARGLPDDYVLGCDSLLDLDGEPIGKPANAQQATSLWQRLSGRSAVLWTGHFLIDGRTSKSASATSRSTVFFGTPSREELERYVATLEPLELAGGFSIEGRGAGFLDGIEGEPSNVIGLSLSNLRSMVAELGHSLDEFWRDTGHFVVADLEDDDRPWLESLVAKEWGRPLVSLSGSYEPSELSGLVAWSDGRRLGTVLYRDDDAGREVVLLHSLLRRCAIGSSLLADAGRLATEAGISRLWLITTDENLGAINFYLANRMRLTRRHADFAARVKEQKPSVFDKVAFSDAFEFECDPAEIWGPIIDLD
jgi:septum formation protein